MTIRYARPDDAEAVYEAHRNEPDNIPWRDADERTARARTARGAGQRAWSWTTP